MAAAAVRLHDLAAGRLPVRCVKTGGPAEWEVVATARRTPGWLPWLLLVGVVPYFVVRAITQRRRPVPLPVSDATWRRLRTVRRASNLLELVGLAAVAAGLALTDTGTVPIVGAAVAFAGVLAGFLAQELWWVGATLEEGEVWLTRVHPQFAREAGQIYAVPMPARARRIPPLPVVARALGRTIGRERAARRSASSR